MPVLRYELEMFPGAVVLSLGQPVLSMLVRDGFSRKMRDYWGYHPRWRVGQLRPTRAIEPGENILGRRIFPFVHQPSLHGPRAAFYLARWDDYLCYTRQMGGLERG